MITKSFARSGAHRHCMVQRPWGVSSLDLGRPAAGGSLSEGELR